MKLFTLPLDHEKASKYNRAIKSPESTQSQFHKSLVTARLSMTSSQIDRLSNVKKESMIYGALQGHPAKASQATDRA
jgi:SET domain-containing protein